MKIVLRADAGLTEGSGHVMRCVTLAEKLVDRGHEVEFVGSVEVEWVRTVLADRRFALRAASPGELGADTILAARPDWVIVDSYLISSRQISELAEGTSVLAVVDGADRGIRAALYVDQNLGAERRGHPDVPGQFLAGSRYALIRDAILRQRRVPRPPLRDVPRVVAFMGGTDPTGTIVGVVREATRVDVPFDLTVVAPRASHDAIRALAPPGLDLWEPTPELPRLLEDADVVISAAGTSAWDVCTLAVPSLLVGVVDNQSESLTEAIAQGLALGIDLYLGDELDRLPAMLRTLLTDDATRSDLSARCFAAFDGLGTERVVRAMEEFTGREDGRIDA